MLGFFAPFIVLGLKGVHRHYVRVNTRGTRNVLDGIGGGHLLGRAQRALVELAHLVAEEVELFVEDENGRGGECPHRETTPEEDPKRRRRTADNRRQDGLILCKPMCPPDTA